MSAPYVCSLDHDSLPFRYCQTPYCTWTDGSDARPKLPPEDQPPIDLSDALLSVDIASFQVVENLYAVPGNLVKGDGDDADWVPCVFLSVYVRPAGVSSVKAFQELQLALRLDQAKWLSDTLTQQLLELSKRTGLEPEQ